MQERGVSESLFDISFTSFITTRIIEVLYALSLIVIGLFAVFFIIGAFPTASPSAPSC
jgi:hypothetical protein